jgi:hypothetical protein
MKDVGAGQTADMHASIAQATRSAEAMKDIAISLAESTQGLKETIAISKTMTLHQERAIELQCRPYLEVTPFKIEQRPEPQKGSYLGIFFAVQNRGNSAAKIDYVRFAQTMTGEWPTDAEIRPYDNILVPGGSMEFMIRTACLDLEQQGTYRDDQITVTMWGTIWFRDQFSAGYREVSFAYQCFTNARGSEFAIINGQGLNGEHNAWEQKPRQPTGNEPRTPKDWPQFPRSRLLTRI